MSNNQINPLLFVVKNGLSQIHYTRAGVSPGSILAQILFNIFTFEILCSDNTTTTTFTDNTTIIPINVDLIRSSNALN